MSELLSSIDAHIEWANLICTDAFYHPTSTVKLDLRFGYDPGETYSDATTVNSQASTEEDEPIELLPPLQDSLWILPLHNPETLSDFWILFRRKAQMVTGLSPNNPMLEMITRRDIALQSATESAIHLSLVNRDSPIYPHLRHLSLEMRMNLRWAELTLISMQVHTGLIQVKTDRPTDLFYLSSVLYKIRIFHFDLINSFAKRGNLTSQITKLLIKHQDPSPTTSARCKNSFGYQRRLLMDLKPTRSDSPTRFISLIAKNLLFLSGYYDQGLPLWKKPDGRYIWELEELEICVGLHDIAVKAMKRVMVPLQDQPDIAASPDVKVLYE